MYHEHRDAITIDGRSRDMYRIEARDPRGLGLAIATTSAAFLPHWEHRMRNANFLTVANQPTRLRASSLISGKLRSHSAFPHQVAR
jgi:hypothetical protein